MNLNYRCPRARCGKALNAMITPTFLFSNDYSKVRKPKKILETLQFKPFS